MAMIMLPKCPMLWVKKFEFKKIFCVEMKVFVKKNLDCLWGKHEFPKVCMKSKLFINNSANFMMINESWP